MVKQILKKNKKNPNKQKTLKKRKTNEKIFDKSMTFNGKIFFTQPRLLYC